MPHLNLFSGARRWQPSNRRCATHLSPEKTDGDEDRSRDGGNKDDSRNVSDNGNGNGNGDDTSEPVPVQTWNKSPIVSVRIRYSLLA